MSPADLWPMAIIAYMLVATIVYVILLGIYVFDDACPHRHSTYFCLAESLIWPILPVFVLLEYRINRSHMMIPTEIKGLKVAFDEKSKNPVDFVVHDGYYMITTGRVDNSIIEIDGVVLTETEKNAVGNALRRHFSQKKP